MFGILLWATAAVIVTGMVIAYRRSGDALHPMLFLGPLFFYGVVLDPFLVRTDLERFFPQLEDLNVVLLLNFLATSALTIGALHNVHYHRVPRHVTQTAGLETERVRLAQAALILCVTALLAYAYTLANAGGFVAAFSHAKGGGSAESGYIGEAMNLGLAGATMVALSRFRRGLTPSSLCLLLVGLLPNIVQGTFGGRRGPLFLSLAMATLVFFLTRPKRPKAAILLGALAATCVAVVFVQSQRQHLYLGSEEAQIDWEGFQEVLKQEEVGPGNNFVYGAGFVLATRHAGQYTWGRELLVNLVIRPVPKQLWPTKYEDVGAHWITSGYPGLGHLSMSDWLGSVGWVPLMGSSAISISDLFGEFSWATIVVMYGIGRMFAVLNGLRRRSGLWQLLYIQALALSIYLATQSFSAFYHRYLILAVPTVLAWNMYVRQQSTPRRRLRVHSSARSQTQFIGQASAAESGTTRGR